MQAKFSTLALSLMLSSALLLGHSRLALGQSTSATADATVDIINALTLNVTDIDFGTVVAGASPSVISVAPMGGRNVTSGSASLGAVSGGAGTITIGGTADESVMMNMQSSEVTLTNGNKEVIVNNFTVTCPGLITNQSLSDFAELTLPAASTTCFLGASLEVGANQQGGHYTGSFTVDISYQ